MSIELTIDRSKTDAQEAITQFAARRGFRLSNPWYLDGLRIEDIGRAGENLPARPEAGRGFWAGLAALFSMPAPGPRIDLELKRRRGRTVVKMSFGDHHDSVHLAYALRSYLSEERAFTCECPPLCPSCSALVRNLTANYCCQCGHLLVAHPPTPVRVSSLVVGAHTETRAFEQESIPAAQSLQSAQTALDRDSVARAEAAASPIAETKIQVVDEEVEVPDASVPAQESMAGDGDKFSAEVESLEAEEHAAAEGRARGQEDDARQAESDADEEHVDERPVRAAPRRMLAED